MSSGSDEAREDGSRVDFDRTKYVWLGIALLVIIMVGALWAVTSREAPDVTRAYVQHILISYIEGDAASHNAAMDQAEQLRQRLLNGEDFAALAREYSKDAPSAKRGGDIGWVTQGTLVEAVDTYIWTAPLNQISPPIASSFGIHLVRVTQRELSKTDQYESELRRKVLNQESGRSAGDAATGAQE